MRGRRRRRGSMLAMAEELAPLKLERAVFSTVLAPADPGRRAPMQVTFTVATNPGAPAGPLNRIASGGELSRFLLALKVCLTRDDSGLTLIFDEIDRGVGGATADAVGRRLAALAEGGQVLVVTHSPQVAALGRASLAGVEGGRRGHDAEPGGAAGTRCRVDEVARMLAGDTVTEEARAAARALLAAAPTGVARGAARLRAPRVPGAAQPRRPLPRESFVSCLRREFSARMKGKGVRASLASRCASGLGRSDGGRGDRSAAIEWKGRLQDVAEERRGWVRDQIGKAAAAWRGRLGGAAREGAGADHLLVHRASDRDRRRFRRAVLPQGDRGAAADALRRRRHPDDPPSPRACRGS
jgi:hypothetical protein